MRQQGRHISPPLTQAATMPRAVADSILKSCRATLKAKDTLRRYTSALEALETLAPTLPTLGVVVTTVDEGRRATLMSELTEGMKLAETEALVRRSLSQLHFSKRVNPEVSKLTRRGAEISKHISSLGRRAEELFQEGRAIPPRPDILSPQEERDLFKAFRDHRERFLLALHTVPLVRDAVVRELQRAREKNTQIAQVVTSPRSKGRTETQITKHVDANIATVVGIRARNLDRPSPLNVSKMSSLLVEVPIAIERLTPLMTEVVKRTAEMRAIHDKLVKRYRSINSEGAKTDPEYTLYQELSKELGGSLKHAETQCRTLKALKEPYQRIKDYLVNANFRLVAKVVTSKERAPERQEELKQDGVLGLMRGIEKFDLDTGLKLSTIATWWIMQAVLRKRPLYHHPIVVPPHRLGVLSRVAASEGEQTKLTDEQLSNKLKVEKDVIRAMRAQSRPILSLSSRSDEERGSLAELIPDHREDSTLDEASQVELKQRIRTMLRGVQPRLADIIRKRFGLQGAPMTLDQIAREMGITRERVRQLEARTLARIRQGPLAEILRNFA